MKAQQITKGGASGGLSRRRRTAQLSITSVLFRIESGQGVFLRLLQLAIFPNYFQIDRFIVDDSINDPLHVIRIRTWQVCDIKHLKLKDPRSAILPQSQPWLIASVAEVCH
ncbi:MAG: hypothetical protein WCB11_24585 [Terriglobales bacterium]